MDAFATATSERAAIRDGATRNGEARRVVFDRDGKSAGANLELLGDARGETRRLEDAAVQEQRIRRVLRRVT
ncbi:MAG: hypothetical protein ACREJX_10915 [Polyangiaceae bacterium]